MEYYLGVDGRAKVKEDKSSPNYYDTTCYSSHMKSYDNELYIKIVVFNKN